MREMFLNGRRMRLMNVVEGVAALLDAQIVGIFPFGPDADLTAIEAVVQTIEQAHGPRGSQGQAA